METSVKAAEVLATPRPEVEESEARGSASDFVDPILEFGRRLDDIVGTYGSASGLLDRQSASETVDGATDDISVTTEKDVSLVSLSLSKLSSPEDKLENLLRKYSELASLRRRDERKLSVLEAERRSSAAARRDLEVLCRELHSHYETLRDETRQRCREDEEKRSEITSHFQKMLTEIQAQIELHSSRNDKLCNENANLSDKLESIMNQCELREESLDKIGRHRDLQHKLAEAKLQEANGLLAAAQEKHHREKEYLLREAIDKTKKCFAMKEQELSMKKKLTLYAQKFDEFQTTLAKSNEIYVRFKKEMDNMSEKMKKMDKESNLWKTRFENCNKTLNDMIEERTEKSKEYELFVLKIQKLERLCRALQEERKVLYDKIKEVRQSNSEIPSKVFGGANLCDTDDTDKLNLLTLVEIQELQEDDPVLTKDMARLREEQAKLQEFADSLFGPPVHTEEEEGEDIDLEEDTVVSELVPFKTKTQADADFLPPDNVEEVQRPAVSTPAAPTSEEEEKTSKVKPAEPKPEAVNVQTQVEVKEHQQQQGLAPEVHPPTDPKPEAEKPEVNTVVPEDEPKLRQQPTEPVQEVSKTPGSCETTTVPSNASDKKQAPKKKKKVAKNSS